MEFDSVKGERLEIVISIRDEQKPAAIVTASVADPQFQSYFEVLYILTLLFTAILTLLPPMFENEEQSPFRTHGGFFMTMTIASSSIALLASACLVFTSYFFRTSMRNIHYTVLKSIGCFFALLALFWLSLVLFVPVDLNWIVYSVVCVFFLGVLAEYYFLWKNVCVYQPNYDKNKDFPFRYTMLPFFFLPISLLLSSIISRSLYLIWYPFIGVNFAVLLAVCYIGYTRLFKGKNKVWSY